MAQLQPEAQGEDLKPQTSLFMFYDWKDLTPEEIKTHGRPSTVPGVLNIVSRRKLYILPNTIAWNVYQRVYEPYYPLNPSKGLWIERDMFYDFKAVYEHETTLP